MKKCFMESVYTKNVEFSDRSEATTAPSDVVRNSGDAPLRGARAVQPFIFVSL
jgi:hypothetical protein